MTLTLNPPYRNCPKICLGSVGDSGGGNGGVVRIPTVSLQLHHPPDRSAAGLLPNNVTSPRGGAEGGGGGGVGGGYSSGRDG